MPNTANSNPGCGPETVPYDTSSHAPSTPVPVKGYPGEKAEGTTVKNPKTPETSKESKAEKVANKAAHKAAKEEQESQKNNSVISK
jgi:hypothetical protein